MPEALVHYVFAASANDSQALLALGYRHLYGINVERSCPAAALYYVAEAQHVVQAAQQPGGLVPVRPSLYCLHSLGLLTSVSLNLSRGRVGGARICLCAHKHKLL